MNPVQLTVLVLVSLFDLGLGAVILQRNSRSRTHQLFAVTAVMLVVWLTLNYLCDQPAFYSYALKLNRATIAAGLLMGVPLLSFALVFPRSQARLSWGWWLLLAPGVVFAAIAATTQGIVAAVEIMDWGTNDIQGPLFVYAVVWGLVAVAAVAVGVAARYRAADSYQKAQYKYLYIGLGLFLTSTLTIAGLIPLYTGTNELARFQPLATVAFLFPTAYAIARHRLMDVSYVVARGAAYTLLIAIAGAFFVVFADIARDDMALYLGVDPRLWVFTSALIAILGLQPARRALEQTSDRLFYRRTYDPDRLLGEMSFVVASALDLEELTSFVSDQLASEMKLSFASVVYLRGEEALVSSTQPAFDEPDLHRFLGLTVARSSVLADDLEPDSETGRFLTSRGVRALVPLAIEGRRLGILLLGAKRSGTMYSVQDARFLKVLASEVSIAIRNAQLLDEKNQRVRELVALNELAFAVGADTGLNAVLDNAVQQVVEVTNADAGSIMLFDDDGLLAIAASVGIPDDVVRHTKVRPGDGIVGWVATAREAMILGDDDPRFSAHLVRADIVSAVVAPVVYKDQVVGVISVSRTESRDPFSDENLHVVTSFAGQLGSAVENARLYQDLEATFLGTISALAAAVDAKDPYTFGHSNEVTEHAVAIAVRLGLAENEVQTIRIASTLHDIGKIGIDGQILHKPSALDPAEQEIIEGHPTIGADILAPLEFLQDAVPLVLFHHERYGGGGYPSGISGQAIPLGARVIAVADSFNAMTSDRPYRAGLSIDEAIRELTDNAGTQFDPAVVDVFLEILAEESGPGFARGKVAELWCHPAQTAPSPRMRAI